jgi:hypothetical protein
MKFENQGVEAHPAALAQGDVALKGGLCDGRPGIGRVVELDEKIILRQKLFVDGAGAGDGVEGEVVLRRDLGDIGLAGIDKRLMVAAAALGEDDGAEAGLVLGVLGECCGRGVGDKCGGGGGEGPAARERKQGHDGVPLSAAMGR